MTESKMWKMLQREFNRVFPHGRICRVESPISGAGIPDVYFKTIYTGGWIELKQFIWKKLTNRVVVPFRPGQFNWLHTEYHLQGTAILLVTLGDEWFGFEGANIKEEYSTSEIVSQDFQKIFNSCFDVQAISLL